MIVALFCELVACSIVCEVVGWLHLYCCIENAVVESWLIAKHIYTAALIYVAASFESGKIALSRYVCTWAEAVSLCEVQQA